MKYYCDGTIRVEMTGQWSRGDIRYHPIDWEIQNQRLLFSFFQEARNPDKRLRIIVLNLSKANGSNPNIELEQPHPGVFIYRPAEGFNYPNANRYLSDLTDHVFKYTRRTDPMRVGKLGDRPWNDGLPRNAELASSDDRPLLKVIILDFSTVNNMDITAAQALIDVRNQLTRYAAPDAVEWRFANIQNRWTKRALASAGFGYRSPEATAIGGGSASIFSIADLGEPAETQVDRKTAVPHDIEEGEIEMKQDNGVSKTPSEIRLVAVHGLNRPYFHVDLQEALEAAIESVDGRKTKA